MEEILEGLYTGGPQDMDRLAFDKALDDIGADETAGYSLALDVLKKLSPGPLNSGGQ